MCGASLAASGSGRAVIERRVVSVLFADLEGFTAFSADRDPEDVREMLTQYFEVCRRVITRHGGLIEKFIGDAVMAVWGTPTAHEDDSVRAVRAALDLVALVSEIEVEPGLFLRIRGGVVTGEAAVTLGTVGQGMVAGDVVNTASRLQSNAPAGRVFVDDATHALTEHAIVFSDGGAYTLKGKIEPVHVWQAESAAAQGHGIEAPFLGRSEELDVLKRQAQWVVDRRQTVDDGPAPRVITVIGNAGVGKSRLGLEFRRYLESAHFDVTLVEGVSTEFGEAGSFGALTQIVNAAIGHGTDDDADAVRATLQEILATSMDDTAEVVGAADRVMALLRPSPAVRFERGELFQAWQALFRALALQRPLVVIFEELQWAEAGLSEFITELIDQSPASRIMVIALARPGVAALGTPAAQARGLAMTIDLAPLAATTIADVVGALVPELDSKIRRTIARQAEGIPLYAVETLRMLANQGVLGRDDNSYRIVGRLDRIEIPQTVQLLVGVRLDALDGPVRDLLQGAAILGMRFPAHHLAALEGTTVDALTPRLDLLVREEILREDQSDTERGRSYAFVQGLLREGAYARLAKRERVRRHLSAARLMEQEAPEVGASHFLSAYRLDPGNADAVAGARRTVVTAAESSAAVGAVENAERYYSMAFEVADDDPATRAPLAFQAGEMANYLAEWARAAEYYTTAKDLADAAGDQSLVARCWAQLARVSGNNGDATAALQLLRQAHASLPEDAPPEVEGLIVRRRADYECISGDCATAHALAERACEIFSGIDDDAAMAGAMHTAGWPLAAMGRVAESVAYLKEAQLLAEKSNSLFELWEACYRKGWLHAEFGHLDELRETAVTAQRVADRIGNRVNESIFATFMARTHYFRGEWDEALVAGLAVADRVPEGEPSMAPFRYLAFIYSHRGEIDEAARMATLIPEFVDPGDADCAFYPLSLATLALDQGDHARVIELMMPILRSQHNGGSPRNIEEAFAAVVSAGREIGADTTVRAALEIAADEWPSRQGPALRGHQARARAHLADAAGDTATAAEEHLVAIELFRQSEQGYDLAVALAEYAIWATAHGRDSTSQLVEAVARFEGLGARPWLQRIQQATIAGSGASA